MRRGRVRTEIFELDEDFGEYFCHGSHKLVHERIHLFVADALLATTEVEGIFQIFGVVRAELRRGKLVIGVLWALRRWE